MITVDRGNTWILLLSIFLCCISCSEDEEEKVDPQEDVEPLTFVVNYKAELQENLLKIADVSAQYSDISNHQVFTVEKLSSPQWEKTLTYVMPLIPDSFMVKVVVELKADYQSQFTEEKIRLGGNKFDYSFKATGKDGRPAGSNSVYGPKSEGTYLYGIEEAADMIRKNPNLYTLIVARKKSEGRVSIQPVYTETTY